VNTSDSARHLLPTLLVESSVHTGASEVGGSVHTGASDSAGQLLLSLLPFLFLLRPLSVRVRCGPSQGVELLHVECAERRIKYGILFRFRPLHEYSNLE